MPRYLGPNDWVTKPPARRDERATYTSAYGSPEPISPLYKRFGWDQGMQGPTVRLASGGRVLRPGERP
jgi:hypothetical protein